MPKSILLTGSTGTLGAHVHRCLETAGHSVTPFRGNLLDPDKVLAQIEAAEFDTVAHFAAMVPVKQVEADPAKAYAVNVSGTIHLLQALSAQQRPCQFFYASSSHVYAPKNTPIDESAPLEPLSLYGRTKLRAEQIAQDICKSAEIPFTSARIFSFYDDRQKPPFLYPSIKARLANEDLSQPFELYGADSQRDLSSAEKLAEKLAALISSDAHGIYNIGSGKGTRIRDFVQSLSPQPLNIIAKGTPDTLVANTEKFDHLFKQ